MEVHIDQPLGNVFLKSEKAAKRVMESVTKFIKKKLILMDTDIIQHQQRVGNCCISNCSRHKQYCNTKKDTYI